MGSLIVAGLALIVLLLSVMLGKRDKVFADNYLILYLTFAALRQLYIYVEYTGFLQESYWMLLGKGSYLLHAPIFFLYVYALTAQKNLPLRHYLIIFFPFVAYTLHFFYYYLWVFDRDALSIEKGLLYIDDKLSVSWLLFVILFLIIEPVFLIASYNLLQGYKKRLLESVSNADHINLNWLNVLFYLWLFSSVVLVPIGVFTVGMEWFSTNFLEVLIEIISVAFFFIVGYYGFKQTRVFTDLKLSGEISGKTITANYERSGLSPQQAKSYHSELLKLMEEQKPYLNGGLTAGELSQLLGISVNYLSQILSQEQKQNFFDFVNGYRVKEITLRMQNPENSHLTLLAMALDSGFNSKTAFNTIFKKATDQTPSQYYRALKR